MLLSFERPAAGRRPAAVRRVAYAGGRPPRTLKTAQFANIYGYHRARRAQRGGSGAPPGRSTFRGRRKVPIEITVKMSRAHGGCLGTRSR